MQLVLLLTRSQENEIAFFLSEGRKYRYCQGKFTTNDPVLNRVLIKEEEIPHHMRRVCHENPLYGTVFNRFTTVSNPNFREEVVILRGLNSDGVEIFLIALLDKGMFRRYLHNIEQYPCLLLDKKRYITSGATSTRGVKKLFLDAKNYISFTPTTSEIHNPLRINFYDEEDKIQDCYYCLCKTKLSL